MYTISDTEFSQFQRFIFEAAGITLSSAKKALVCGRLAKRLKAFELQSYSDYFRLLKSGGEPAEVQTAIDLLTTNETYFFREPKHFELLRDVASRHARAQPFRIWSAASSTGEEAYSMAMVLADTLGDAPWEVIGSDISTRVLARARTGHYPVERTRQIPIDCLKRHCLRGIDEQQGTVLVDPALRRRVSFTQVNLNTTLPRLPAFDAVFLRNVMIYFNGDTKRQVILRIVETIKPGGMLCIGHSESLNDLGADVDMALEHQAPSVYRKRSRSPR